MVKLSMLLRRLQVANPKSPAEIRGAVVVITKIQLNLFDIFVKINYYISKLDINSIKMSLNRFVIKYFRKGDMVASTYLVKL